MSSPDRPQPEGDHSPARMSRRHLEAYLEGVPRASTRFQALRDLAAYERARAELALVKAGRGEDLVATLESEAALSARYQDMADEMHHREKGDDGVAYQAVLQTAYGEGGIWQVYTQEFRDRAPHSEEDIIARHVQERDAAMRLTKDLISIERLGASPRLDPDALIG